jgi:hypothetical protein
VQTFSTGNVSDKGLPLHIWLYVDYVTFLPWLMLCRHITQWIYIENLSWLTHRLCWSPQVDDALPHSISIFLFSTTRQMQNMWPVADDMLCQTPHWWSSMSSSAHGVNLDRSMLDKILSVVDTSDYSQLQHPYYKQVQWLVPSTAKALLVLSKQNI